MATRPTLKPPTNEPGHCHAERVLKPTLPAGVPNPITGIPCEPPASVKHLAHMRRRDASLELRVPKSVACRTAQVREQLRPFDPLSRCPELVEGMTGGSSLGHNGARARSALRMTIAKSVR